MEVINKPTVSPLLKSFSFFQADKRKWMCLALVILIPVVYNSWRYFPSTWKISYYEEFSVFWWNFSINFISLLIVMVWSLTVPRKDYMMKLILSTLMIYGIYMSYMTLPLGDDIPLYVDILAIAGIYVILYSIIRFTQKNYLEKKPSYESMHINLLHDLNHRRFMGAICRIEGMVKVSDMEEYYRDACEKEIEELKETFAYITEKYENIH